MEQCQKHELPIPEFKNEGSDFWVIFKKDIFNNEYLENLKLNKRQINAVLYVKEKRKISNKEYQILNNCSRNTASNDLAELLEKNILKSSGKRGAGSFYELKK